jgi:NADH-quinone oxidoreductase subunit F
MDPILLRSRGTPDSQSITTYLVAGGYNGWEKVLRMTPEAVIGEVNASELRGRGGAGFPTGKKWSFVPRDHPGPRYLVCNADESEPGTFKDREIIEHDPHLVVEGVAIASFAIRASVAYIYIRGEFVRWARILEKAISARTSSPRATTSKLSCTAELGPMSAARRRRLSSRSKASAASPA